MGSQPDMGRQRDWHGRDAHLALAIIVAHRRFGMSFTRIGLALGITRNTVAHVIDRYHHGNVDTRRDRHRGPYRGTWDESKLTERWADRKARRLNGTAR